ncbi:MAG TPA: MerR family transcriptional regulator [Vicinamibacterales bacterium]|nr:MerR family transcriptional regulator [Vicinamibacterales bacterium]
MTSAVIPNRPAFRAQEVCEIAGVQPYVLRGWEAEFPDLGVAKAPNGPRVYRRADVERVLRLKHLIQVEGLTLAGARRRLDEESEPDLLETVGEAELEAAASQAPVRQAVPKRKDPPTVVSPVVSEAAKAHLQEARQGLQWILQTLSGNGVSEFALAAETSKMRKSASRKVAK